jgi:glycosyltransferase involved in cell wall biosynthesis
MRILFIVPYAPSLIRVRPYHFVRGLAERGHRVVVAAPLASREERTDLESLREFGCEILAAPLPKWRSMLNCLLGLTRRAPLQSAYCWQPELALKIEKALGAEPFDIIHVEHLRGARYGLRAMDQLRKRPAKASFRPRVIWDSVDCISSLFGQASERGNGALTRCWTAFEQPRTRAYEGAMVGAFDRVVVTTEREADELMQLAAPAPVTRPAAVCNGVDLDYFAFRGGLRSPETIVMTGKMSYHANVAAAKFLVDEVMPLVWKERPRVKVELVGKNPTREVSALAYPQMRPGTAQQRGEVVVTGEVLDLRPHLWRAAVAVAPIVYGAGVQNKVLEAMAASTPVVCTQIAVGALRVRNGKDLFVGSDPSEMASHLLTLLANQDLRRRIGDAGRTFVEQNHGWQSAVERLESVYQDALEPARDRAARAAVEWEL